MLSDEEKEAIEYIKNCLDNEYNFKNATRQKDKKAYNIILNLIEKDSKEIEELRARNFELEFFDTNKKWEDKIKAKIEEVNKKYKAIESNYTEQAIDAGDFESDDYVEMQSIQYADDVLESLLEKE